MTEQTSQLQQLFHSALQSSGLPPPQANMPSELHLDLLETNLLEQAQDQQELDRPELQQRLTQRRAVEAQLDETAQSLILENVLKAHAAHEEPKSNIIPLFGGAGKPLVALAVAASAAALFLALPHGNESGIRPKGELPGLVVYRERSGSVVQAEDKDTFYEGDRLRFEVDLKAKGHIMIVGVEASGKRFSYFPLGEEARSKLMDDVPIILPGAARLDSSKGWEWIHLISCDRPFTLTEIDVDAQGQPKLPAGCLKSSYGLFKEARP